MNSLLPAPIVRLSAKVASSLLRVITVSPEDDLMSLPVIVKSPPIVTSSGNPIVIVPLLSATVVSFAVAAKVIVPPRAVAVELEPSVTVMLECIEER